MSIRARLHYVLNSLVLLSFLVAPLQPLAQSSSQFSHNQVEAVSIVEEQPAPEGVVSAPEAPEPVGPTPLFRTQIRIRNSSDWLRLEKLGVVVLERTTDAQEDADSDAAQSAFSRESAVVLADEDQLEALARLRFEPRTTDELGGLVMAHAEENPWLAASLRPFLSRAAVVWERAEVEGVSRKETLSELRTAMRALTPEIQAALAGLTSLDDDGDGLSNTQEAWWCTDPMNTDSDGDGASDADEVQAAKDWLDNETAGPPATGKPFAGWPPETDSAGYPDRHFACQDDDKDAVPDLAERWELGLNMNRESTDRDKFDDGQELFGLTHCPGSGGFCGYGSLPRNEDWGVIFAEMPAWVERPGNHPLVAAFPVPEIDLVESSLHMETVTVVTTDHTIAEGTERSYSTARTEGTSSSVADTVTWNEWQEVSITKPLGMSTRSLLSESGPIEYPPYDPDRAKDLETKAQELRNSASKWRILDWIPGVEKIINVVPYSYEEMAKAYEKYLQKWEEHAANRCDLHAPSHAPHCTERLIGPLIPKGFSDPVEEELVLDSQLENQDQIPGGSGSELSRTETGEINVRPVFEIAFPARPVPTRTDTSGRSWGGARTTTHTEYEEHTITEGEAFSNSQSWGTATAIDSAHAADLWFSYTVHNTGSEYSREVCDLVFNIYLGDNPNPTATYSVGPDLEGDGCFNNLMPDETHTYTSRRIPLTLGQMKAADLGETVFVVVEDFTYGIDELFYQDALNAGVQIAIEDGTEDNDENIDTYLIPTWGEETALDVLARYFPHETDENDTLTAIWTPEYVSETPDWCVEPKVVGVGPKRTLWCKHALSTADWWNVYTSGLGGATKVSKTHWPSQALWHCFASTRIRTWMATATAQRNGWAPTLTMLAITPNQSSLPACTASAVATM